MGSDLRRALSACCVWIWINNIRAEEKVTATKTCVDALLRKRFDFPFLVSELCCRGVDLSRIERWLYVDSIDAVKACNVECAKLQCMFSRVSDQSLQAHRALADCFALRRVVHVLSERLGVSLLAFLKPFVVELDSSAAVRLASALCS